jgi:hypothetical protein
MTLYYSLFHYLKFFHPSSSPRRKILQLQISKQDNLRGNSHLRMKLISLYSTYYSILLSINIMSRDLECHVNLVQNWDNSASF